MTGSGNSGWQAVLANFFGDEKTPPKDAMPPEATRKGLAGANAGLRVIDAPLPPD